MPIRNCRNLCSGKQFSNFNPRKYLEMKYCANCRRWVKHEGRLCPCCNSHLRTRSLNTNLATRIKLAKLQESKQKLTSKNLDKKREKRL